MPHATARFVGLLGSALWMAACDPATVDDRPALPAGQSEVSDILGMQLDFFGVRPEAEAAGLTEDQQRAIVVEGGVGRIAMNLVWAIWEPDPPTAGPCPPDRVTVPIGDGRNACYRVDAAADRAIEAYRADGIPVTAVVYGVPAWAGRDCPLATDDPRTDRHIFCGTLLEHAVDYGRFGRFIAERYPEVDTFVVHNEVNARQWYWGTDSSSLEEQADAYARDFRALHDAVRSEDLRPDAAVCVSLEHHFLPQAAAPHQPGAATRWAGTEMLAALDARLGEREWSVAMHSYPHHLGREIAAGDALDFGEITYGSVGTVVGWLRQRFPHRPSAWRVHLTENGIDQLVDPARAAALGQAADPDGDLQADAMCRAYRNVLATPGIESHVYHRLLDPRHPTNELAEGPLRFGLFEYEVLASTVEGDHRRVTESALAPKPAWERFRQMHRLASLDCGFEHARRNLTRLARYDRGGAHWVTTRLPPHGAVAEGAWFLERTAETATIPLFACHRNHAGRQRVFVTRDPGCEGELPEGPVGYAFPSEGEGRVELFRCGVRCADVAGESCADEIVTADRGCEGHQLIDSLGFALADPGFAPLPETGCDAVRRIAGVTRFETAAAISREAFAGPVERVVLVNGDDNGRPGIQRPDAVVAGPHAARHGSPILYVRQDGTLPPATVAELERLRPGRIDLVGGEAAIPAAVEESLATRHRVERIAGDRFLCAVDAFRRGAFDDAAVDGWQDCSAAVRETLRAELPRDRASTAADLAMRFADDRPRLEHGVVTLVAGSDSSLVDALAASPAAARAGYPILLSGQEALGATTREALSILAANTRRHAELEGTAPPALRAVVVGAVAARDSIAAELSELGYEAVRLYGEDRVQTAIAVLLGFPGPDGTPIFRGVTTAAIAGAHVTVDAIAASTLKLPILLTPPDSLGALNSVVSTTFSEALIVGGSLVVSRSIERALEELLCRPSSACPSTSCWDDLGREVCEGSTGVVSCPGGSQVCRCDATGSFSSCTACVSS